ncbi:MULTISPECIES: YesK-like family protein [Bacillus]|uniref:YesK-like family protein n=1 Tax=Bacillus TaxID=1386 RepID=UPI001FB6A807|nr:MULTISPECIES: YesK-like family protein [Bacillus]MDR0123950.1 YesK-like family protein [Bacillus zhangzhouensis]UOG07453.1 YesK-like family protein [Bacillus altitudinis]
MSNENHHKDNNEVLEIKKRFIASVVNKQNQWYDIEEIHKYSSGFFIISFKEARKMSFWLLTTILTVIIFGISLIFKKRNSSFQYGFPAALMMVSIILLIISFFVGRWEGLGLGAISVSLLISSVIALIITSISGFFKSEQKNA